MKTFKLFLILVFLKISIISWSQVFQSSCEIVDSNADSLLEIAYSIALEEMFWDSHYYHDSVYVPAEFVDSIFLGLIAYENAYDLSESFVQLSEFQYFKSSIPILGIILNDSLDCYDWKDNGNGEDQLIIVDTLINQFIDSLNLSVFNIRENEIYLIDTNNRINLAANFEFLTEIPCIDSILDLNATGDPNWLDTTWIGEFTGGELFLSFQFADSTGGTLELYKWLYSVNTNCEVIIHRTPLYSGKRLNTNAFTYPNPFSDRIVFDTDQSIRDIKIHSLDGRLVKEIPTAVTEIQTSDLNPGVYILSYKIGKGVAIYKIVKH